MLSALDSLITAITSPIRQLFHLIQRITPGSQAFGRLSLPMRWAVLAFLCLSIALVAALIRIYYFQNGQDWNVAKYALLGIPLVVIISILVYWFVVFWLKEESSKYPDIDRVMLDGLQQLAAGGISVASTPIFIVLGTEDANSNRLLLEAANLKLPVQAPKTGEGPLSFLASKDAIWIMPNSCNAISRLSHSSPPPASGLSKESPERMDDEEIHGTVGADDIAIDPEDQEGEWGRVPAKDDDQPEIEGGTIHIPDDFDPAKKEAAPSTSPPKKILGQDLADTEDRLRYLCGIIKKARRNICPINGLLTTIPFELIENHHKQLSLALQKDLQVLRDELQIRVANTLLVTGMEDEPGFIEMTRRLGPQRIAKQRIGKGADVWVSPENKRLAALAKHATAVFEDQIFDLFQQEDSLRNKQNAKLFSLLSRMRGSFANHLTEIMETGFGFDPIKQPELANQQFLFSGCYFAACGPEKQRQAFVASAINKVIELCDDIEWMNDARNQDARYRRFANWMALLGLLAVLAIAFLAIKYRSSWWPNSST